MAGCIAFARASLFRHPSFFAEDDLDSLVEQFVEDPRLLNSEAGIYDSIASTTTPFVSPLDEMAVNIGPLANLSPSNERRDVFRRLLANLSPNDTLGMF